jgi:hypothetical protein
MVTDEIPRLQVVNKLENREITDRGQEHDVAVEDQPSDVEHGAERYRQNALDDGRKQQDALIRSRRHRLVRVHVEHTVSGTKAEPDARKRNLRE